MQQISGRVIKVDSQSGTSKAGTPWEKKIIVIEFMDGDYAKNLALEMFGSDRCAANPIIEGQDVTLNYTVDSSEWNGRWFTTAHCWGMVTDSANTAPAAVVTPTTPSYTMDSDDNDLPF